MELVIHELNRLIDDYHKCDDLLIKEQIFIDIQLLRDALLLLNTGLDLEIPLEPA